MLQSISGRTRILLLAAATAFLIYLVRNPHYGFHGDELYFIICGQHPQWNYVDQPPIAPLLAAASQIFGPSLVMLRAVPAIFAGAGIYVTCLLVIEFGGAAYAQVLTAIVVFFLPVLTDFGMKLHTDMVGLWSWPLITLWIVRLTKGQRGRRAPPRDGRDGARGTVLALVLAGCFAAFSRFLLLFLRVSGPKNGLCQTLKVFSCFWAFFVFNFHISCL